VRLKNLTAYRYIFFEMLPSFIIGVLVFLGILLMFQALRLTEFILIHGVDVRTIGRITLYLSVSFLPVILPMSLLFSILLTYSRMSQDSEIVAFRALGVGQRQLLIPALLISLFATVISLQTAHNVGPWGNYNFERLIHELGTQKVGASIKAGVFSEGFFDFVVYANDVDTKTGKLDRVFIYDERQPDSPLTIISKTGRVIQEKTPEGWKASLELQDGKIHRTVNKTYTQISFETYEVKLFDPHEASDRKKSPPSMTTVEVGKKLDDPNLDEGERKKLSVEYHRRWSLPFVCLVFGLIGVALGTTANRRHAKSSGFVLCLIVIVTYWVSYVIAEGVARNGLVPAWVSLWAGNLVFFIFGVKKFRSTE